MKFEQIAGAFAGDPLVSRSGAKGFGSGALRVNGKIFARMSSKRELVVNIRKERVDELVSRGQGEHFDPGHGRVMEEWPVIRSNNAARASLAGEACDFVKKAGNNGVQIPALGIQQGGLGINGGINALHAPHLP